MKCTEWKSFFEENNVQIKAPPFGLAPVKKSTDINIKEFENEMNFQLPEDYKSFCIQIGPGTLGRVKIFSPQEQLSNPDPRFHHHRIQHKFQQKEFIKCHSFPLEKLVFFAQDTEIDAWFAWKNEDNSIIYIIDEQPKAPPPKKIANSFTEFVKNICLGTKIESMGIYKFSEDPSKTQEPLETWSDDEEDPTEYKIPPQTFTPFGSNLNCELLIE